MKQYHPELLKQAMCAGKSKSCDEMSTSDSVVDEGTPSGPQTCRGGESTSQENKKPCVASAFDPMQLVTPERLLAFNCLIHPIWVFDPVERRNRWANNSGLQLWDSPSLEEFTSRDMTQMSAAAAARIRDAQCKVEKGLGVEEQWTIYPKGIPKTVHLTSTGLRLSPEEDHFCLLCYAVPLVQDNLLKETLRGNEMLHHLPLSVCQFEMNGAVMYQNPASAIKRPMFDDEEKEDESTDDDSTTRTNDDSAVVPENGITLYYPEDSTISEETVHDDENKAPNSFTSLPYGKNDFVDRFVNPQVARAALKTVQTQDEANLQAELHTSHGPQWSSIHLRKMTDPLTGRSVILYTSQDKTDAMDAKREREASLQKSEFLAIMAHEIRTPLHQVTGFIDLLADTRLDDEQSGFVKLLKSSAQGLMTVISDVLDYSKLEAGQMKMECIPYEPLSVLQGSMAAVRASCEEKGLSLTMNWNKKIPFRIMGDPNRLRQILLNLLSNAIKFTMVGGIQIDVLFITVGEDDAFPAIGTPRRKSFSLERRDSSDNHHSRRGSVDTQASSASFSSKKTWIKFVVTDTGIGIAKKHMKTIFETYQQGNLSVARNFGGTGLGLSICQLLVNNMGGSIDVESHVGHGSSFWFALPVDEPEEKFARSKEASEGSSEDETTLKVLIAEDNRINQKLMVNMMKRLGHEATIAENGKIAMEMIQKDNYDVVFMDIQMPVMDGLEATRRLRCMGYTDLPIYGLTASVKQSDYSDLGFDDWLPKPLPMSELKTKLQRLMKAKLAVKEGQ